MAKHIIVKTKIMLPLFLSNISMITLKYVKKQRQKIKNPFCIHCTCHDGFKDLALRHRHQMSMTRNFVPRCLFAVAVIFYDWRECVMSVLYLSAQNTPIAPVLTLGNKVLLYSKYIYIYVCMCIYQHVHNSDIILVYCKTFTANCNNEWQWA